MAMPLAGWLTDKLGARSVVTAGIADRASSARSPHTARRRHQLRLPRRAPCSFSGSGSAARSCPRWPPPSKHSRARRPRAGERAERRSSGSPARSARPCSRSCSSARSRQPAPAARRHRQAARRSAPTTQAHPRSPAAFATSFWVAVGTHRSRRSCPALPPAGAPRAPQPKPSGRTEGGQRHDDCSQTALQLAAVPAHHAPWSGSAASSCSPCSPGAPCAADPTRSAASPRVCDRSARSPSPPRPSRSRARIGLVLDTAAWDFGQCG